jgi:hypothetical protein
MIGCDKSTASPRSNTSEAVVSTQEVYLTTTPSLGLTGRERHASLKENDKHNATRPDRHGNPGGLLERETAIAEVVRCCEGGCRDQRLFIDLLDYIIRASANEMPQ